MKMFEKYPDLSEANRKLLRSTFAAAFEYVLEVGENEACQSIIDENIDITVFPHIEKRVEKYLQSKQ